MTATATTEVPETIPADLCRGSHDRWQDSMRCTDGGAVAHVGLQTIEAGAILAQPRPLTPLHPIEFAGGYSKALVAAHEARRTDGAWAIPAALYRCSKAAG